VAKRKEGKNAYESIFEACVTRFLPVMLTIMAALFGTLPIAGRDFLHSEFGSHPDGLPIFPHIFLAYPTQTLRV